MTFNLGSGIALVGLSLGLALAMPMSAQAAAHGSLCGTDKTVEIAEMSWPSAAALAQIHAIILERGFGCDVELVVGDTVPTMASLLAKGSPAIAPELWTGAVQELWDKGVADGQVVNLGPALIEGVTQGWFIPTYLAEANPGLRHAEDLADHWELFADPDDPSKGRFTSCPPGWACEIMNPNFVAAYGLDDTFNVFSPGSGGALDASIMRAFTREEPIVFYYWGPTAMMGRLDMTRLDMDAFDADKFACMGDADCMDPQRTDFIVPSAIIAAASWLPDESPAIAEYLGKAGLTNAQVGAMMLWGEENSADAEATAENFIATQQDIWGAWVSEDVASAITGM